MRNHEKLRPYDLANAKVGDKVLSRTDFQGEVVFTVKNHVAFHWNDDVVSVFRRDEEHVLIAAPLAWSSDDEPVYVGETLYHTNTHKAFVVTGGNETALSFEGMEIMLHASLFTHTKPVRTIRIGKFDVPEPVREPLEVGQDYFVPYLTYGEHYSDYTWDNDSLDEKLLEHGMIHLTKEAAELHAKALLSFTQVKE